MREVIAVVGQDIPIGRYGEHLATCVSFDISEWVNTYGEGVVFLLHRRNGDSVPCPCEIWQTDDTVTWTITQYDVGVAGRGMVELQYFVNGALVKSETYVTVTERSLYRSGEEAPEPYNGWLDKMLQAASVVVDGAEHMATSVREARDSANEASDSAYDANGAAGEASKSAIEARGSANEASDCADAARTSADEANSAADAANFESHEAMKWRDQAQESAEAAVEAKDVVLATKRDMIQIIIAELPKWEGGVY